MNDPNACRDSFYQCRCVLPAGHEGPHECAPDPTCGGSWLRHPDDMPMVRVYRWPGLRPECDAYDALPVDLRDTITDPAPGEYVLEPDDVVAFRAPRGGIKYFPAPDLSEILP
jgi:hypothetical protein